MLDEYTNVLNKSVLDQIMDNQMNIEIHNLKNIDEIDENSENEDL